MFKQNEAKPSENPPETPSGFKGFWHKITKKGNISQLTKILKTIFSSS